MYRRVDSYILVYDITNKYSFEYLGEYIKKIKDNSKKNAKVLILGHKSDYEDKREVSKKEGSDFANLNNFLFFETSSLQNLEIIEAFEQFIDSIKPEHLDNNLILTEEKLKKRKKKCC